MITSPDNLIFVKGANIDASHPHGDLDRIDFSIPPMPIRSGYTTKRDREGNLIPRSKILAGTDFVHLYESAWERLALGGAEWVGTQVEFSNKISNQYLKANNLINGFSTPYVSSFRNDVQIVDHQIQYSQVGQDFVERFPEYFIGPLTPPDHAVDFAPGKPLVQSHVLDLFNFIGNLKCACPNHIITEFPIWSGSVSGINPRGFYIDDGCLYNRRYTCNPTTLSEDDENYTGLVHAAQIRAFEDEGHYGRFIIRPFSVAKRVNFYATVIYAAFIQDFVQGRIQTTYDKKAYYFFNLGSVDLLDGQTSATVNVMNTAPTIVDKFAELFPDFNPDYTVSDRYYMADSWIGVSSVYATLELRDRTRWDVSSL